jgi:hypothetical protein
LIHRVLKSAGHGGMRSLSSFEMTLSVETALASFHCHFERSEKSLLNVAGQIKKIRDNTEIDRRAGEDARVSNPPLHSVHV